MRSPSLRSTLPPSPNASARPAIAGIQRKEIGLGSGHEDAPAARGRHGARFIQPSRYAAAREIAVADVTRNLWIEHPVLASGRRVEGDDAPERRAQVHGAVDHERCRFERRRCACGETAVRLAGAIRPRHPEPVDVLPDDFRSREYRVPWTSRPLAIQATSSACITKTPIPSATVVASIRMAEGDDSCLAIQGRPHSFARS